VRRAVQQIGEVEVLDVVARDDVRVALTDKLGPFLRYNGA
jgi:hypothetical protein